MTTTTKQQPEEEVQDAKLLLRRFELMEDFVNQVRKTNLDNGLNPERMDFFIEWRELRKRKQYEKWLQSVTNPKTGKFYTVPMLKAAGIISEEEQNQFEDKTYHPYRKLHQLYRIKLPNGEEYLRRLESWHGLTKAGSEKSVST